MDSYLTLSSDGEAIYTEKRSKFYAFAFRVKSEEDVKTHVAALKKKFYDARHICYAYALGNDASTTRCNDDGEPAGSAGKPILGQIRSAGVTFVLVAVVRYFGGVKLGTGGLATAYKTAAAEALSAAEKEEMIITQRFEFEVPYTETDTAIRFIRNEEGNISEINYTETGTRMTVEIRCSQAENLQKRLSKIHSLQWVNKAMT